MLFAIMLLIGAGLLTGTLLSVIFATNPFIMALPFIGTQVAWFAEMASLLLPVSVFIIVFSLTRNIVMSLVLTIVTFVAFLIMGVITI